ncbi:hypothetical protein ZIOFF_051703 [Zingiber officinale]|uniref:Uncharacterized protein n=1 Tax=Zingiber officinale TaxID=94328 RepID=A0A8J5FJ50_ZINOF|nr:hypothetical protein ZIOFF_051703 [Zingiber officinale]
MTTKVEHSKLGLTSRKLVDVAIKFKKGSILGSYQCHAEINPVSLLSALDNLKLVAAFHVLELVRYDMILDLGIVSTIAHALNYIDDLRDVVVIPTSEWSAISIPLSDLNSQLVIDMPIDDEDEVDLTLNLMKGCDAFLLR